MGEGELQGFNSVVAQTASLWWSTRSETTFEGNESFKSAFNFSFKSLALPKTAPQSNKLAAARVLLLAPNQKT